MTNEGKTDEEGTEIGRVLKEIRKSRGFSLRDVERSTDGKVSNGYLSQLENGGIDKPSAIMLHRLAGAYAVDYHEIMRRAGYVTDSDAPLNRVATSILGELTSDEEDQLLQYLTFIRSQKK